MHINEAKLLISAVKKQQYPDLPGKEIALLGRSNVGKSSFINRMVQRKGLARTSSQPGKTQTLNFYRINDQFNFVDVPGYGYAKVSKVARKNWEQMIEQYLINRPSLSLIFMLMDFRHEPTQLDKLMKEMVESIDIPYAIVLTKTDKVKKNQWQQHLHMYKKALDLPSIDALFPFSAETGEGRALIWEVIEEFLE